MDLQDEQLPPPPKKQGILNFGHSAPAPQVDLAPMMGDINSLSRRLKVVEEGLSNFKKFFQVSEENSIAKNKHFSTEIKTANSDILEVRKEMQEIKEKLVLVIKEMQSVARKEEVKVLEKYINLWNPIKFVSQNEVEQIINEILEKKANRKV